MKPIITLHGLDTIYRKIKDWFQERPIENDLMAQQVVFNGWPYVNMAYPLLEQSMKALVIELDKTKTYNPQKDGHSLKTVFGQLKTRDQKVADRIRKGYVAFQSLHNYVGYRTLDEFIDNIDKDYVKWRYYPLEGWKNGQPATTSVEAMLEVARQTLDIFAGLVATDPGYKSVGNRLEWKIRNTLLTNQLHIEYQEGTAEALTKWAKENNGSYLNGVAKIVWCENNEDLPIPYQFKPPLSEFLQNLILALLKSKDRDMQQLLLRAMHAPKPLVWDRHQDIFR